MFDPIIEAGQVYRLRREFELRDEQTGTLKQYFLKGTELKVRKVAVEEERVWVEGVSLPLPLAALRRVVEPRQ
jgi:hypothetical protein